VGVVYYIRQLERERGMLVMYYTNLFIVQVDGKMMPMFTFPEGMSLGNARDTRSVKVCSFTFTLLYTACGDV